MGGAKSMHRDFMQASRLEQRVSLCLRRIEARIETVIKDVPELEDPHISFKHDESGALMLEIGLYNKFGYHARVFLLVGDLIAGGALACMTGVDLLEYIKANYASDKTYI